MIFIRKQNPTFFSGSLITASLRKKSETCSSMSEYAHGVVILPFATTLTFATEASTEVTVSDEALQVRQNEGINVDLATVLLTSDVFASIAKATQLLYDNIPDTATHREYLGYHSLTTSRYQSPTSNNLNSHSRLIQPN